MLSKTMMRAAAVTLVLGAMTLSVASADALIVVNPNFRCRRAVQQRLGV
jgi:hypothetical protein